MGISKSTENIMDGKNYQRGSIEKDGDRQRNSETIQDQGITIYSTSYKCSDFDYIRMDMSEQHANMKDSLSQTVTCYLSAAIRE